MCFRRNRRGFDLKRRACRAGVGGFFCLGRCGRARASGAGRCGGSGRSAKTPGAGWVEMKSPTMDWPKASGPCSRPCHGCGAHGAGCLAGVHPRLELKHAGGLPVKQGGIWPCSPCRASRGLLAGLPGARRALWRCPSACTLPVGWRSTWPAGPAGVHRLGCFRLHHGPRASMAGGLAGVNRWPKSHPPSRVAGCG